MRAVAIPYIIALVLGVAVIGLVGYWFATSGGKFGGQSAKTLCDNKFLQWCVTTGGTLVAFVTNNAECKGLVSYNDCNELTGSSTTRGATLGKTETSEPRKTTCQSGVTLCKDTNNCADCGSGWRCNAVSGPDVCVTG